MSDDLVRRLQREKWQVSAMDLEDAIAALEAKDREIERLRAIAKDAAEAATQHQAAVLRLRAECASLKRDAGRYRWLQERGAAFAGDTKNRYLERALVYRYCNLDTAIRDAAIDAAIDAALSQQEPSR